MGILYANDVHVDGARRLLNLISQEENGGSKQQAAESGLHSGPPGTCKACLAWAGPLLWLAGCLVSFLIFPYLGRYRVCYFVLYAAAAASPGVRHLQYSSPVDGMWMW